MKRALLALILALPLALSAQFRIVGTGLFTTLNDSTYRAKIDFRPDLTGNSYNATQLNDSMLVLSQKGQLYRLDSFYNASFSSAFIIVVEKNGNWGSPVGQVMVFQNNSSLAAPQAVYGANGATAGMQAGVDTWNALLLKVVSDSAVYWNQAYSNSIDSLNVSGDSLKTITLYRASGDSISATFVDGGGSGGGGPVTDTLTGEVKGPLDSTYIDIVANINFTTTTDTTVGVGELKYNDTQGSLIQGLKGGNVTNVIGQQIHQRVTNATGGPLTKGTAVFLHGSQGNRITVRKALATVDSTSANTFGIVTESIANNQSGYVITEGLITNMNTNALTEGAAVYLSPTVAGELTTTKPQAPQHTVYIGVCVKQNAGSGELFVKIRNGQELDELHDVRIDSPVSNASLYYNTSESVWRDTTPAALKSDISGTTNYLAKFTGSNAVGNSVAFNTGRNLYINSTQGNTSNALNNSFEFNGYGSAALDQPFLAVIGNVGVADYRPRLAMYRTKGTTVNDRTLVPFNHHLGSIQWNAADGVDMFSTGAEITAITDSITGENDMPTALTFATTANGSASTTERMRITSAGNVGINTTNPVYRLHVDGEAGIELFSNTTNGRVLNFRPSLPASKYIQSISAEDLASVGAATGLSINANGGVAFSTNSSTSLNERMRIAQDGNIGIGTAAPRTPLDIRFSGSYPNYYTDTIARVEFNETGAGCCMDITGMYVKANGGGGQSNVGIIGEGSGVNYDKSIGIKGIAKHNDTQGPGIAYGVIGEVSASKLGSSGAIGTTIAGYFKNTAKVDGTHYGVLVETDSSGDYGVYQTGFGANYFKGNVGINTTTPAYRLDVNGDVNTTGMYKKSGTDIISGTTNYIPKFTGANTIGNSGFIENGQEVYLGGTTNAFNFSRFSIYYNPVNNGFPIVADTRAYNASPLPGAGWNFGGKKDSTGAYTAFGAIQGAKETSANSEAGYLQFSTNSDGGSAFPEERMRITSAGNVGIGTASPLSTPVGIGLTLGTTSSGRSLYMVSSADGNNGLIQFKDQNGADALQIAGTSTSNWLYGYGLRPLRFFTNATEVMRIEAPLTGLGNVGIHTSSPSRPLHVAGTTAIRIPVGNFAERGTSDNGDIRVRTDTASMEYYSGAWRTVAPMARVPQSGLANRFSKFDANGLLDTSAVLVQANGRIGIWNSSPAASDSVLTVTGGIYTTNGVRVNNGISNFFLTPSGSVPGEITTLGLTHTATSAGNSPGGIVALALTAQTPNTAFTYGTASAQGINAARIRAFHAGSAVLDQLNGVNLTARNLGAGTVTLANGGNFVVGNSSQAGSSANGRIINARGGTFTLQNSANARINNLYGAYFIMINDNDTAGSIGNIYGTYLESITGGNPAAVSVTNLYGYYIPSGWSAKATNKWSFYADDANAPLYSAGKIGAGVTTPQNALDVEGGAVIGASYSGTNTAPTNGLLVEGETRIGMTADSGAYALQVNGNAKLIGNLARKKPVTIAAATYTVLSDDSWLICNHTAQIMITLPTAANSIGRELMIKYVAGGGATVISNATNVSPIVGGALTNIILPATAGSWVTLVCDGANWIIMQKG